MYDPSEEQLNRLTLAGWFLIIICGGVCVLLVPYLVVTYFPVRLEMGTRLTKYAIMITFMPSSRTA